ncbi:hypothetical protein BDV26DRAFT_292605 [Aspergillus bertholletiae]|uniref:Zn(2)-C6 fungal-type domain-containing protein n=1 Tax=Aspergillus bertholletiae TaxID=1226010 RepID=A0A5N7B8C1_9EURO|nr:hypothetical protein BDV26DRAFT_292605 [Aspergillus bertholletiae]
MKVRSLSVCQTCRERKLGCDGKRPECTQCRFSERPCPGYKNKIIFVPQGSQPASRNKGDGSASGGVELDTSSHHLVSAFTTFRWSTVEEFFALGIAHFIPEPQLPLLPLESTTSQSLVCASWLGVLPKITDHGKYGSLLVQTIRTLGLSILCKGSAKATWNSQRLESYCSAIHLLRNRLLASNDNSHGETTAAIMTLTLSELMFPTSKHGWIAHVKAVSELMRHSGPAAFVAPPCHKLFVGFRALILTEAILSRTWTFLELPEWQNVPFQQSGPSSLQRLLSCAVSLPSLLQQVDRLKDSTPDEAQCVARDTLSALYITLQRLEKWEKFYHSSCQSPLYWLETSRGAHSGGTSTRSTYTGALSFPNVVTATSCIFLWAFKIVCLTEMDQLMTLYNIPRSDICLDSHLAHQLRDHSLDLSVKICQSMAYFLDDTMKFYGPGAAMFPFSIAYGTLYSYRDELADQVELCMHINGRLSQKGFYIEPLYVKVRLCRPSNVRINIWDFPLTATFLSDPATLCI